MNQTVHWVMAVLEKLSRKALTLFMTIALPVPEIPLGPGATPLL